MEINQKYILREHETIREALDKINQYLVKTLIIIDSKNIVKGVVSEGDIRRLILRGVGIGRGIAEVMNKDFHSMNYGEYNRKVIQELRGRQIYIIPIIHSETRELKQIIDLRHSLGVVPVDVMIMAGGEGTRLRPLTENTPKPLLKVGDKPIIEHNIDRLRKFGIENINISVKYLGEMIREYFGNGENKNIRIGYVEETKKLGTAGALSLVDEFFHEYILLMNSDLLTDIDYSEMFDMLISNDADMIMATVPYEVNIPYGVVTTEGDQITSLKEKPTYTYYSNAGIYIFKKKHLNRIAKDECYNATDLLNDLLSSEAKVLNYPIRSYWLDIGKPHDFEKAQKDIIYLNI